jgi:dTDP-glucose 4,6-dehydratase
MEKNKKVFLTGALGVIGKPLWRELKSRGYDVFGCDLYHSHDPKYFRCDIGKYRQLEKIFEAQKFDYVYNLAAEFGRWNGEDFYENLWTTNAIGLKNIIRLQEKYKFKLVHFSSSEVYGDYDGVMQEDVMDKVEIKQLNDYAMTKWVNEMQILNSAAQFKTETVRVRIFNVYGPGEYYSLYRSALCRFVYCALNKMPFTVYKGHTRSWLFIDDVCKTLANIVENFKAGEVYNIANPESLTIEKLAEVVLEKTGAEKNLANYKEGEPFTTRFKKVDISKAKRDLNHNPQTSIETGVEKTVNWMKEFYKI